MRALEELSGRWTGFWIQDRDRGHMGLTLRFSKGKISGDGLDSIGSFTMKGSYETDDTVSISKKYRTHRVDYSGKWDGSMIFGIWKISIWDSGEFEIWPEKDDEAQSVEFELRHQELALPAPAKQGSTSR